METKIPDGYEIDFDNPPEGYYTYWGSGKYWGDPLVLMKTNLDNPDKEPNYKLKEMKNGN